MMNKAERYPPPHRRKTPSFSSSLLDSILRSIDETNNDSFQQQLHDHDHDHDVMFFASEPKRSTKVQSSPSPQVPHLINHQQQQIPSLRRAIMIDQWMETHNIQKNKNKNRDGYVSRKLSSDSSSSTTGTTSSETTTTEETPSTYRSLPNSFTISRKTAEAVFLDDTQKPNSTKPEEGIKFMRSTKLRAMKIYTDLKKPVSPGSRISAFIYSLFASKKAKTEESMHNLRSFKKSRSIKHDHTCTSSFSRSCMSKKQHSNSVKRSVRFYPAEDQNDTVRSIHDQRPSEGRWFAEKNYTKSYKSFMVNIEDDDDDEDEDDLFELEIVGGVGTTAAYAQELPVFETTDLRKIRIN